MKFIYVTLGWFALILLVTGCGGSEGSADTGDPAATGEETARGNTGGESGRGSASRTENTATPVKTTGDEREATRSGAPDATGEATATGSAPIMDPVPERAAPPEFVARSEMRGGSPGAADSVQDVRFGRHEGYERVVIDFWSGGEAAERVPAWTLSSPTGEGYARIYLPGIFSTATTGGDLGGSLLEDYYVVRSPGGGVFVDVFATGAFRYRVLELQEPGRLAIDFRPVDAELDSPLPARDGNTVLMSPRPGASVESPLSVGGYSRNFEAANTIRLLDGSGNVLAEKTVLANGWAETWGYFEASVPFEASSRPVTLQVGASSPRDGSFEGVEIPVNASAGG